MNFFAKLKDGSVNPLNSTVKKLGETAFEYELSTDLIGENTEYVFFPLNEEPIKAGSKGFYLLPAAAPNCGNRADGIGFFTEKEDYSTLISKTVLPVFGYKHDSLCRTAIITGMRFEAAEAIDIKNGEYNMELRFYIEGVNYYENIKLEIHDIIGEDTSYADIARVYRNYQLSHGFRSIKDRLNPTLAYAAESPNIRIRMGWKPVPCQVHEQTVENEPPMHVACTFEDVRKLLDEYKAVGVEKAEICLVGWNVSGHDGRWPQVLPVEEKLGGKEELLKLTAHAKELGYRISCHTNSTDAYSIADCFNRDELSVEENGEAMIEACNWGGGRTYMVCPKYAYENVDKMLLPITDLGFDGIHYIDVISCIRPHECHSKVHPTNMKETAEYWTKTLSRAKEIMGGIGSEGSHDHCMKDCDTALYVTFYDYKAERGKPDSQGRSQLPICDEDIPFWQLVYHGIVMSNPFTRAVNAILADDKDDMLKVIEYGGKPQVYVYAKFVSNNGDWIGRNDFFCHTDEERRTNAENVKKTMDIMGEFSYLQYEFMEKHEKLGEGVYAVTYSDGSVVTVDYNSKTYSLKKAEA